VSLTPSYVTTRPSQPLASPGSLADVPQTPAGRLDSGGITYGSETYPQSFQIAVPSGGGSYSYSLGGQWLKIYLYIVNEATDGAFMSLSVALDDQPAGSEDLSPETPYVITLNVGGVQALTISFQNAASLSAETVQIAGNLYH